MSVTVTVEQMERAMKEAHDHGSSIVRFAALDPEEREQGHPDIDPKKVGNRMVFVWSVLQSMWWSAEVNVNGDPQTDWSPPKRA